MDASVVPTALSVTGDTALAVGIEYQWQSSPDNTLSSYTDITGEKAATYSVPSISTTTYYRRMIQRVSGLIVQCELPSLVHKITVHSINVGQIAMPTQICYGTVPDPLVSVNDATSPNGAITYQWQYSPNGTDASWVDIANATSNSFTPPGALIATSYFRRQVINQLIDQDNRVTIGGTPTGGDVFSISINLITTSVTTGTSTGTYANILIDHINANGSIPVTASQTVSGVINLVPDTPGTDFTLAVATNSSSGGTIFKDDSTPNLCTRNSRVSNDSGC